MTFSCPSQLLVLPDLVSWEICSRYWWHCFVNWSETSWNCDQARVSAKFVSCATMITATRRQTRLDCSPAARSSPLDFAVTISSDAVCDSQGALHIPYVQGSLVTAIDQGVPKYFRTPCDRSAVHADADWWCTGTVKPSWVIARPLASAARFEFATTRSTVVCASLGAMRSSACAHSIRLVACYMTYE